MVRVCGACASNTNSNMPPVESAEERDIRLTEEAKKHDIILDSSKRGFIRGAVYGAGVGLAATLLASRLSPTFRSLRLPVKGIFVSMAMFGGATFASEHTIYRLTHPDINHTQATSSSPEGWLQCLMQHRLGVVGSAISAAVIGTGWKILQNKNTNGAQKFMDIRLYGQMAGLTAIVALMGLSAAKSVIDENERKERAKKR